MVAVAIACPVCLTRQNRAQTALEPQGKRPDPDRLSRLSDGLSFWTVLVMMMMMMMQVVAR